MICPTCGTESRVMRSLDLCKSCSLAKSALKILNESRAVLLSTVLKRLDTTKSELEDAIFKYDGTNLDTFKRVALASVPREELVKLAEKHTTSQIAVLLGFGEPYIRSTLIKQGIEFTTIRRVGRPKLPEDQKKPKSKKSKRVYQTKQFESSKTISPVFERALDRAKRLGYID